MRARSAILGGTLLFVGMLAALTLYVAATSGVTVLTVVALLVLGMLATGVIGALLQPPPEE